MPHFSARTRWARRENMRRQRSNIEDTTMNAERTNGVGPARPKRRIRPANGVGDNACQSGTQPSYHGSNGARAGAENSVDNACHSGTQPSHHASNGGRPSDEAPEASERDPLGRFAPGNQGGPGN